MTCDETRPLLEEYHDRELAPARAEEVRTHVAGCGPCAAELASLEKLDRTLRAAPAKSDPVAWDRYVDRVRDRTRGSRRASWKAAIPLAAAAALILAFTRLFAPEPVVPSGSLLDRYAAAGPEARASLERSVATLDRDGLASLALAMVTDPDPARRQLAARLLGPRLNEDATRKLLLDQSLEEQRRDEEAVLVDLGFEEGDEELVAPAVEMARRPENFDDAVRILRRLDRGTLNRSGHSKIVERLRELLNSDLPKDRDLAIRIAGELEILAEDLVEFLDVPGLGDRVLEFLKRRTGQDFGKDKTAWRGWFGRQSSRM
jgi:hypothetical protein